MKPIWVGLIVVWSGFRLMVMFSCFSQDVNVLSRLYTWSSMSLINRILAQKWSDGVMGGISMYLAMSKSFERMSFSWFSVVFVKDFLFGEFRVDIGFGMNGVEGI
jgi:hypothetical protein